VGVPLDDLARSIDPRQAPPHLTEPWFCCAAPTRRQLGAV
jgi:hypothetical protein